ncbi:hypothetical protein [Natranaerobius trueperi]|uniref:hypothetical protein n=1 Tax=Natranaerobius trueperi TaxID=759412 RepID=UPI00197C3040|nr:hypothetical protein [Natranaerobius trueperi]
MEINNLTKHFNISSGTFRTQQLNAVDNISFRLFQGETLGIVVVNHGVGNP